MLRLALYQPDIPQNAGTMIRLAACLGVAVDIVEPASFDVSDRNFRRSGMDYVERAAVTRHDGFRAFEAWRREAGHRLVLAETDGACAHVDFAFRPVGGGEDHGGAAVGGGLSEHAAGLDDFVIGMGVE